MVKTDLCDLLGIDVPVIQGSIGPWTSPELSAAISNAGALGSIEAARQPADRVRANVARMRELTDRPFAVNHTLRPLDEEAFALTLDLQPPVVSLALGSRRDLVERAHDAGCLFVQQVHTVEQGIEAAERRADAIIAQGSEAGGWGGVVSTMALVPQVVDAVRPVPVLAAGGIADGRGLAAALALGAQGVNIGTRFLASVEAGIADVWKQAILAADSSDAVKLDFAEDAFPPAGEGGYETAPRALRTAWLAAWNARPDTATDEVERLRAELVTALETGRGHDLLPFAGQSAGLIHEVLPVAEIIRGLVDDAERALLDAAQTARA